MTETQKLINTLQERKDLMVKYLDLRVKLCDWHGVMDAAADIREIEAQLNILRTPWGSNPAQTA